MIVDDEDRRRLETLEKCPYPQCAVTGTCQKVIASNWGLALWDQCPKYRVILAMARSKK
jgi:hypothetical protein